MAKALTLEFNGAVKSIISESPASEYKTSGDKTTNYTSTTKFYGGNGSGTKITTANYVLYRPNDTVLEAGSGYETGNSGSYENRLVFSDKYWVRFIAGTGGSVSEEIVWLSKTGVEQELYTYKIQNKVIKIYNNDSEVATITATASTGYTFDNWTPGGSGVIPILGNTTFTANFKVDEEYYTMTFTTNGNGSVDKDYIKLPKQEVDEEKWTYKAQSAILYLYKDNVEKYQVKALPNTGCSFIKWIPTGSGVIYGNLEFKAYFDGDSYKISFAVTGDGYIDDTSEILLLKTEVDANRWTYKAQTSTLYLYKDGVEKYIRVAKPNSGSIFSKWNPIGSGYIIGDLVFTANFTVLAYYGQLILNSKGGVTKEPILSGAKTTTTWSHTFTSADKTTKSGYTQTGWSKDSTVETPTYKVGDTINMPCTSRTSSNPTTTTVYATWEKTKYSYVINYNGNIEAEVIDLPDQDKYPKSGKTEDESHTFTISKKIPKSEGVGFLGWSDTLTGKPKDEYAPGVSVKLEAPNTTLNLYAIWDQGYSVNITPFPLIAGTINGEEGIITKAATGATWTIDNSNRLTFTDLYGEDQKYTLTANTNYRILKKHTYPWGYLVSPTEYIPVEDKTGTFNANKIFAGLFTGENYTLKFNLNNGSIVAGKEALFSDRFIKYKDIYSNKFESLASDIAIAYPLPDASALKRDHYTFLGWSLDDGATFITNNSIVETPGNKTLKAIWQPITYKVKFLTSHGTFNDIDFTIETNPELTVNIPNTYAPFLENYLFYGWNTTSPADEILEDEETPEGTTFQAGDTIVYSTELFTANILNLYCKWRKDPPVKVAIPTGKGGTKFAPVKEIYVCLGNNIWKPVEEWYVHNGSTWKEQVKN